MINLVIELVEVSKLRHIEDYCHDRVAWLKTEILKKGFWTKPIALDSEHYLVLDGQHRMEAALALGLNRVPAIKFNYDRLKVVSLRDEHQFDWKTVVEKAIVGDIYPYKTVKHEFLEPYPRCRYSLEELRL